MILGERSLSIQMQGDDVRQLHTHLLQLGFALPAAEVDAGLFGPATQQAVEELQRQQGLPITGIVDAPTASSIEAALAGRALGAVPQAEDAVAGSSQYTVQGYVRTADGSPVASTIVKAFDRDLRREEPLGEAITDEGGHYQIGYVPEQFQRAEKKSADLIVRAFSQEGSFLAASPILFNAPLATTLDLLVTVQGRGVLSEVEQLIAELAPVLDGIQAEDLTDEDITFLAGETELDRERIEIWRQSSQLAKATGIPAEAFYGWARKGLPLDLARLLATPAGVLRTALESAIAGHVLPEAMRGAIDGIMAQVDRLRARREGDADTAPVEVIGQLLNSANGAPVAGYTVQVLDTGGVATIEIGRDVSDTQGYFSFTLEWPVGGGMGTRSIRLSVLNPEGQQVHQTDAQVNAGQTELDAIRFPAAATTPAASPALAAAAAASGSVLPPNLLKVLAQQGIHTLADVRQAGPLQTMAGLPVPTDDPALRLLDAHAALNVLSADLGMNSAVIAKGFTHIGAIARSTRAEFVTALRTPLGDVPAAKLHAAADAQQRFLHQVWTDSAVQSADGFASPKLKPVHLASCHCNDCAAAVSPTAYLADLLDYAVKHLKENHQPVSLAALSTRFHQPFGELPASCKAMEEPVRQARLCVEVLRRYLKAKNLPIGSKASALVKDEQHYRLETYRTLLGHLGTSYDEIRLARTEVPEKRAALAERLGVDLGGTRPDALDALYLDPAATPLPIPEAELETLFGLVDTTRDPLLGVAEPILQTWRRNHLRSLWQRQDFPEDLPSGGRPLIDPDLIGPDDFRRPFSKAQQSDADEPFDLWIRRRAWVDSRLGVIASLTKDIDGLPVPDFAAMLVCMAQPLDYPNTQVVAWSSVPLPAELDTLLATLRTGSAGEAAAAKRKIESDLHLTIESFTRLWAIYAKDRAAAAGSKQERVTGDEWWEAFSILVQAQKTALFPAWRGEEQLQGSLVGPDDFFGPKDFWIALREPADGQWPPVRSDVLPPVDPLSAERPWIDPESVKLDDLPDPIAGKRARELWEARKNQLGEMRKSLKVEREANGVDAMLRQALGDSQPGDPLPVDLDALAAQLQDPSTAAEATAMATNLLRMTAESFTRLMALKAKGTLSAEEAAELTGIVASAQKVKREFPVWIAEENDLSNGVLYWTALRASLPGWRASREARREWQEALRIRRGPPLIDPDVIGPADLKDPTSGIALDLWNARKNAIQSRLKLLKHHPAANDAAKLEALVLDTLDISPTELSALDEMRARGGRIDLRLDQLTLPRAAFLRLMRFAALVKSGVPVLSSEWDDVYAILVQVEKRRRSAKEREEEKTAVLCCGPDFFKMPELGVATFPPPPAPELLAWRATREARRSFQDTLQARIEQEQSTLAAWRHAASKAEAATLPRLRDALILASDAPGADLAMKAQWLADRLLIDTKTSGCQETTRISQAIETVQGVLFSTRNGLLGDAAPNLVPDADHFEKEWPWIGSYATWRAAMFVFLYPENILLPSLRRREAQTPAFREVLNTLRGHRRLTPEQAREAAKRYEEYLRDVSGLTLQATCQSKTRVTENGDKTAHRTLFYMFARGAATGRVYWSAGDRNNVSGYTQSFWNVVPGLETAGEVIGAVPYTVSPEERFIYLFVKLRKANTDKLLFTRYDLLNRRWDESPTELKVPEEGVGFTAVIKQRIGENAQPRLAFRTATGVLYARSLKPDGSDWDGDDWEVISASSSVGKLYAFVGIRWNRSCMIVRSHSGELWYRLFGDKDDAIWRVLAQGTFSGALLWPETEDVVVWYDHAGYAGNRIIKSANRGTGADELSQPALAGGIRGVVPTGGGPGYGAPYDVAYQRTGSLAGLFRCTLKRVLDVVYRVTASTIRIAPRITGAPPITERLNASDLQARREWMLQSFSDQGDSPQSGRAYLEEAYYFVPVQIASELCQDGQYTAALDWFRIVYDYSAARKPVDRRKIYAGLQEEDASPMEFTRAEDWLLDPLNPHAIADNRQRAYTRFTLISLVRCLLDFADAEFTRDTAESVPRARELYLTALEILDVPELKQQLNGCDDTIGMLDIEIDDPDWVFIFVELKQSLTVFDDIEVLKGTVEKVKAAWAGPGSVQSRFAAAAQIISDAASEAAKTVSLGEALSQKATAAATSEWVLLSQPEVASAATKVGDAAAKDFLGSLSIVSGMGLGTPIDETMQAPWLGEILSADDAGSALKDLELFKKVDAGFVPSPSYSFCIPPNPILRALRLRAELNLYKLRNCRNIAGMERQIGPYAAPTDTVSGLPVMIPNFLPQTGPENPQTAA